MNLGWFALCVIITLVSSLCNCTGITIIFGVLSIMWCLVSLAWKFDLIVCEK